MQYNNLFSVVLGGQKGIKGEGCRKGGEGGLVLESRLSVETLVERSYETRKIGLFYVGNVALGKTRLAAVSPRRSICALACGLPAGMSAVHYFCDMAELGFIQSFTCQRFLDTDGRGTGPSEERGQGTARGE
jgi:hypothetical protein